MTGMFLILFAMILLPVEVKCRARPPGRGGVLSLVLGSLILLPGSRHDAALALGRPDGGRTTVLSSASSWAPGLRRFAEAVNPRGSSLAQT